MQGVSRARPGICRFAESARCCRATECNFRRCLLLEDDEVKEPTPGRSWVIRTTVPSDFVRVTWGVGVVLAMLMICTACSGSEPARPAPIGSTLYVTPPPPVSNTAPIGAVLHQQLTNAVTRYEHVDDSVYLNPRQNLTVVDTVAIGQAADALKYQAKQVADQHLIVTGEGKVLRVTVVSTNPNPLDSSQPATATVKSCSDVSATTVTTPDGKSNVDPRRGSQVQTVLTLTNATPAVPTAWRVSTLAPSTSPCDPT